MTSVSLYKTTQRHKKVCLNVPLSWVWPVEISISFNSYLLSSTLPNRVGTGTMEMNEIYSPPLRGSPVKSKSGWWPQKTHPPGINQCSVREAEAAGDTQYEIYYKELAYATVRTV